MFYAYKNVDVYCSQYIILLSQVTLMWNLGTMSQTKCQYCNTNIERAANNESS